MFKHKQIVYGRIFSIFFRIISIKKITNAVQLPNAMINSADLISTIPTGVILLALPSQAGFFGNHFAYSRPISPFSRWNRSLREKKTQNKTYLLLKCGISAHISRFADCDTETRSTFVWTALCTGNFEQLLPLTSAHETYTFRLNCIFHRRWMSSKSICML